MYKKCLKIELMLQTVTVYRILRNQHCLFGHKLHLHWDLNISTSPWRWIIKNKNIPSLKIEKDPDLWHRAELCIFSVSITAKSHFKVQTHQRKFCPRLSPALSAGSFPSTVCLLYSAETLHPDKWRCTNPVPLHSCPPELCSGTPTSRRSSEMLCYLWSLSSARSCGWEVWGVFPHPPRRRRCRRLWTTPGCRRSRGLFVGWWSGCSPVGSRPERTPGLDRSSTPAGPSAGCHRNYLEIKKDVWLHHNSSLHRVLNTGVSH